MTVIGKKIDGVEYSERKASYAILKNIEGRLATVEIKNWGLIFLGGKIEDGEDKEETIKREALEEVGYRIDSLKFYETFEVYYELMNKGEKIFCHAIVDFYTGEIGNKIQDPTEKNHEIKWFYPQELFGKMKLDFQNFVLEKIYF